MKQRVMTREEAEAMYDMMHKIFEEKSKEPIYLNTKETMAFLNIKTPGILQDLRDKNLVDFTSVTGSRNFLYEKGSLLRLLVSKSNRKDVKI